MPMTFHEYMPCLSDNREVVSHRQQQLKTKFKRDKIYHVQYTKFDRQWIYEQVQLYVRMVDCCCIYSYLTRRKFSRGYQWNRKPKKLPTLIFIVISCLLRELQEFSGVLSIPRSVYDPSSQLRSSYLNYLQFQKVQNPDEDARQKKSMNQVLLSSRDV